MNCLVMVEDLMVLGCLRKRKLSEIDAYFKKCPRFVAAGRLAHCMRGCRICDGNRKFQELKKFFDLRNSSSRPERKFIICIIFYFNAK